MGFGRNTVTRIGRLIEPPEQLCRFDVIVEFVALNERVGLLPESNFLRVAIVPSVSDDAVISGSQSGQQRRLRSARDGGDGTVPGNSMSERGETGGRLSRGPRSVRPH